MQESALLPEKYRVFSGSALKVIAVITMLIDHVALVLLGNTNWILISFDGHELTVCEFMIYIGRIAFPIYAFLLVEGFVHTRSRKKYGRNLLLFAFISEIPWNLEHTGTLFYSTQNVFFTLFLGFLGLCAIEKFDGDKVKQFAWLLILLAASVALRADYGCSGFGFILLLYVLRNNPCMRAIIGSCFLSSRWIAGIAFIPISLYNGKRGFIKGKIAKYCFYAFYPVHMLVLYLLRQYWIGY